MTRTKKFTSDPINSTFRWVFHFTDGMAAVRTMDGYSKGAGAENTNKHILLIKKLTNPILPKFSKCDLIEVFANEFGVTKDKQGVVLRLHPHKWEAYGEYQDDMYLRKYLDQFYTEYLQTGKTSAPPEPQFTVTKAVLDGELSHKVRFKDHAELRAFIKSKEGKYEEGFLRSWYWKHLEIQPELEDKGTVVTY